MDGKVAGLFGMLVGGVGILAAGLIGQYTEVMLICGTVLASVGIIAVAISTKSNRGD